MTDWAAKVLEGVPRLHPWHNEDAYIKEADALAAIARMGAGPAGLEAARVAAERGHKVVVFEAADQPGGQVRLTAQTKRRAEVIGIIDWLSNLSHTAAEKGMKAEAERNKLEIDLATVLAREAKTFIRYDEKFTAAEAERDALRERVARLEGAGDFARLIGNDDGKDDKDTVLVSYGMLRRLRAALTDGGKDG